MSVFPLTEDKFDWEVLHAQKPVVVDFWAAWCGPCRMLAPVLEELAARHPEVKVAKINVDEAPVLASRYQIRSIPYVAKFVGGEMTASSLGYVDLASLEEKLGL